MDEKKQKQILTILFVGVLMGALDVAMIGPAMPTIRTQLGLNERQGAWIFSIYILFNLIGTPLMAKLSDLWGRRNIYVLDVALFGAGSLVAGISPSYGWLLFGRAMQGLGAGGIVPVAGTVIGETFPAEKRGRALGLIGAVFGIAFLLGPFIAGPVVKYFGWRWLFFVNLPIAVALIFFAMRLLPTTRIAKAATFDWAGMALLGGTLACLAIGLNQIDKNNLAGSFASPNVNLFLLASAVLLAGLVWIERRAPAPMLPPSLFNRRQLVLAYAISAGAGIGEVSMVFVPEMVRSSLKIADPALGGMMMLPVILAMAVGSPMAGRFLDKWGSKTVILLGSILMTVGMILMSLFSTNLIGFILTSLLIGLGLSALLGAPIRYIMLNESSQAERSMAQGVAIMFISIGQILSSVLVGAIASGGDYATAFLVNGCIGAILIVLAIMLKNQTLEIATRQAIVVPSSD
jgi:EmrB/QacA subfamily drug resistance transporter